MSEITKIAAVATTNAIWEYDPDLPDNRVINGAIDVVAVVQTIAVKVMSSFSSYCKPKALNFPQILASSSRIEYFEKLQTDQGRDDTLKLKLHSNIRWGSAHGMLARASELEDVPRAFTS